MRFRSAVVLLVLTAGVSAAACRDSNARKSGVPAAALPPVNGAVDVPGLLAPVTVIRDTWGVPHISAENTSDLFIAQGFVQAQDRLFQMDLWRRGALGRLSEVLGANFIQRDAMTRRVQYPGDINAEWGAYGEDTRAIVTAFTRGVNAWIDRSREAWPEEFRLAGWAPEHWSPDDLLNRTDAFVASAGAEDELFRARLSAALGIGRVNMMLPPRGRGAAPGDASGVDLAAITAVLGDAMRRAGAPPFFAGFAAPFGGGSNVWAVDGSHTASGQPLLAVDPHRRFDAPGLRYLVHLRAPGWNVAGATSPWLPGVVIGHNARVAWGMASAPVDVQDIYVERLNPLNPRQVEDAGRWVDLTIVPDSFKVKGRVEPFEFERQYTRHGVVIGLDREKNLAYVLRWSGSEAGAAGELAALHLDRAQSAGDFDAALGQWKLPAVDVAFAERDGGVALRRAALEPRRLGFSGALPANGWSGRQEWSGWVPSPSSPSGRDTADGTPSVRVATNDDDIRAGRLRELLTRSASQADVERFAAMQRDAVSGEALMLVGLLKPLTIVDPAVLLARQHLANWDGRMATAAEAQLFDLWRTRLVHALTEGRAPAAFADGLAARLSLPSILSVPTAAWFDGDPRRARDTLLVSALRDALSDVEARPTGFAVPPVVEFRHPLALSDAARQRFNRGPFSIEGDAHTVQAISDGGRVGPSFRAVFDAGDWDRSLVINAPGQSGWPDSPHYADMTVLWSAGRMVPLPFSEPAIRSAAAATLTLRPAAAR